MTDEEFVKSLYEDATLVATKGPRGMDKSIEILTKHGNYRYVGWNVDHSDAMTWFFARRDLEFELLRKLES